MDGLYLKLVSFSIRFIDDQQNEQNKQKLGKMKKRKKRKSKQIEGLECIVNNQQLFKHEMKSSNSLITAPNKVFSSRKLKYNCYTTNTTINQSKCKSSNLRKNRSIAAISLFLVKLFISINLLSLDVDNVTQATSQINSVWLSKDEVSLPYNDHSPMVISASSVSNDGEDKRVNNLDNGQIQQQHRTSAIQDVSSKISSTTNLQANGSEKKANWSSLVAGTKEASIGKTSSPPSLHTSSSSLQPAIVSMDQPDDSDRSNSIKRSDSDSTLLSYVRSFNNSDDSTNLDQLWNNRNHTTTNSQVQFDEGGEQQQNFLNRDSNLNQPLLRANRHQDNETSTLFPQYDSPVTLSPPSTHAQPNDNENQFIFKTQATNSSHLPHESIIDEYLSTATYNNKSDKKQDSDSYYVNDSSAGLDNGDLIASPEPLHIVDYETNRQRQQQSVRGNQARRRLHNSGTQYDFRERERATTASLPSSSSSPSGVPRSPSLQAANFNYKQTGFNDGEMLAYNGGDEDDENRLKSIALKHDNNLNSNSIDNLIQFNNRPSLTSQLPYDTFETTSDRFNNHHSPKSNIYQPTTPLPYHTNSQSHSYLSPQTPIYPISKYLSKNNQIPNTPKSRYVIHQVPSTTSQRIVTQHHPTPVVKLITRSGINQDGVTRQDGSIWNQFATTIKQSDRDKIQQQQQLLVRGQLPILNYVSPSVVPNALNRQSGQTSMENNVKSDTATQKPTKKSLLAALSNRFNNWVDASRGSGNSLVQNSLENSFYNTNQHQVRRMRPNHHHIASPLSAANYYHLDGIDGGNSDGNFYGDISSMQSASVRQPIQQSAITLLTAADHNHHHPSVIRSPIAYYPPSYRYVNKGNYLSYPNLLSIQQPTVSPAPSRIERFYGGPHYSQKRQRIHHNPDHLASYQHQYYNQAHNRLASKPVLGSEPSSASFIPVVAVSVTKTSPAPMSSALSNDMSSSDNQQQNVPRQQQQPERHNSASEIDDYLDMRLGNINRDRRSGGNDANRPHKSENEFGNYASSSIKSGNNHNQFLRTARPAPPIHEHTTTVKSAVFGYLPHQIADNPLLKAVNILPQFAPRVSYLPGHHHPAHHHVPSASDAYVNHGEQEASGMSMNESPQIQDHHQHRDDLDSMPIDEPPPSLALQLQANSFVQNDIAHPFLDHQSSSRKNQYLLSSNFDHQPSYNSHHQAAGTYGGHSAHHITPIDVYPASQHQMHGFQLFKPGGVNSYQLNQGGNFVANPLLVEGSSLVKSPHLLATSSELNPLMQSIMLANPTNVKFQLNHPEHHQNSQHDDQTASSSSSVSSPSNANDNVQDSDSIHKGHSSSLNKGNKKRSSEFFANAGQLLLSALPLLLAPTLGLMFASTPNSVARFQGSNPFSGNSNGVNSPNQPAGIGSIQHSLPSTYINSLNTGSVSNPSPAPVVFTPTPPGYLMTTMTTSSNRPNKSTKSPQHTTSAPNLAQNSTNGKARSTTPKVIVTVTTSSPPLQSSNVTNDRNESENALNGKQDHHEHSQIPQDYDASSNSKLAPTTILQDSMNSSITMTTTSGQRDRTHYDIGYEGVDFDAQFASLRKPTWQQQQDSINKLQPLNNDTASSYLDQSTLNLQKPIRVDKNRYQYSEVMPLATRNKSQPYLNHMDQDSSKLYPVSTWPTMRRKTISLVTSNGNKTLLDSSDKYPELSPLKPAQNVSNIEPSSPSHNNNNNINNNTSNSHHQSKPLKAQTNKQKFTTPSYDDEDVDDLEDTNLDTMMEPLNKINTTINILTKKLNPNLLNYEQANNGSNYDISSLFDLASEQTSLSGHSKIVTRRKRDIERIEKLDQHQSVGNNNKTTRSNRTKSKKKVRKVRIKQSRRNSDAILKLPADYNITTALGNNTSNQTMTTLESRNNNSINDILSDRSMRSSRPNTSNSSDNQQVDQLKGDASKSKSAHIITTMITHLADDEDDAHGMPGNNGGRDDYNIEGGDFGTSRDASELREQLIRKKILLDKIASSAHNSKLPLNSQQQQQSLYDEQNNSISDGPENGLNNSISNDWLPTSHEWKQQRQQNFSFGGRGRFPTSSINKSSSVPIEVISTKIKLYPDNVTDSLGYNDQRDSFGRKKEGLILNDDTKKALENFGSLLIKDTMKIPKPISSPSDDHNSLSYNRQTGRKSDSARTKRRSFNVLDTTNNRITKTNHHIQRDDDTYGAFETSSTEPNLVQTTSFPADAASLYSKENSEPFHSQTPNDDRYSTGNWQKDQNFYPTNNNNNNNNLRETRYTQNINPRRLYTNRSEEEYERAALNENHRHNQKYDINSIDHHNYRNHNNGAAYDSSSLDNHVRTMRDRVSLVENDLPNYAPSADDRSSENSYSGNNIPSSYPTNDEPTKLRQSGNNQQPQQQYQRGTNLQTFRSDPTAPINSYSLYTMHHINRSSSGSNSVNSEHQPESQQPAQPVHLTQFSPSSGFYAPGNHSSLPPVNDKRNPHDLPPGDYNTPGDISHVYSHSNGHYGPNRRDPPHQNQHLHLHRTQNYQSNYEPRNHRYQDQMAQHPITSPIGSYQQESNDQNGYQYTTYAPNLSNQPMQPIYSNHKPSGSHQFKQRYQGEFLPQTKSSNNNDHLPPMPDSTPYSHQHQLPKFYQPSSEIRYPTSSTNRNQEMGYANVGRPSDSSSSGNIYYPPSPPQHHLHSQDQARMYTRSNHYQPLDSAQHYSSSATTSAIPSGLGSPIAAMAVNDKGDSRVMNEYFKRVQFNDSDRDKLMAR